MNYTSMTSEVKSRPRILQCAIEALRSLALFGTLHNNPRSLWTSIRVGVADWIASSIKRMFGWWRAKEVKSPREFKGRAAVEATHKLVEAGSAAEHDLQGTGRRKLGAPRKPLRNRRQS